MKSFNFSIFQSFNSNNNGQSLAEIIIAISVAGILIGSAVSAINLFLKIGYETKTTQASDLLSSEYVNSLLSLIESSWTSLYSPPGDKGADSQFYLSASGTTYVILPGTTSTVIESRPFTRYFSIENVNRDSCGVGDITTDAATSCVSVGDTGVADDPSTQKIAIKISWPGGGNLTKAIYLTRNRNLIFSQNDWSGGGGQENFSTSSNSAVINSQFSTSSNINFLSTGVLIINGLQ